MGVFRTARVQETFPDGLKVVIVSTK